jgi:hypothetical protein
MPSPNQPPSLDLDAADLYLLHRAHVAMEAVRHALSERWGKGFTTVLLLRATARDLCDVFFSESTDSQRTIIGAIMTEERQANEARLHAAVTALTKT